MQKSFLRISALCALAALVALTGCAPKQSKEDMTSTALIAESWEKSVQQIPKVTMGASMLKELAEETRLVNSDEPFEMIVPTEGSVSSKFGIRKHPTKKRRVFHQGIDINAKRGTPVMAAAAGRVLYAGNKGRGYGKVVEIDHGNGFVTRYAHLDTIFVQKGKRVTPSDRIGLVGRTGRTTGPNLHLEVIANGKPVNPESFFDGNRVPSRQNRALVEKKRTSGGS